MDFSLILLIEPKGLIMIASKAMKKIAFFNAIFYERFNYYYWEYGGYIKTQVLEHEFPVRYRRNYYDKYPFVITYSEEKYQISVYVRKQSQHIMFVRYFIEQAKKHGLRFEFAGFVNCYAEYKEIKQFYKFYESLFDFYK